MIENDQTRSVGANTYHQLDYVNNCALRNFSCNAHSYRTARTQTDYRLLIYSTRSMIVARVRVTSIEMLIDLTNTKVRLICAQI